MSSEKPELAALENNKNEPSRTAKCVICDKPSVAQFFPFCSSGCRKLDLHRWLSGSYILPGDDVAVEDAPEVEKDPR